MELQEGHLYVHLELGSGAVKVKASRYELNDGSWHKVALTLRKQQGRISIDGDTEAFETPGNFRNAPWWALFVSNFLKTVAAIL